MHRVERSVFVSYSAEQMFDLVVAVKDYPEFLPWCAGTHVRELHDGQVEATIEIHYRGVRSRFTTRNRHVLHSRIRMDLVNGPFRRLAGDWIFHPLCADACKVHLNLHYQFAAGLLGRAIAPLFDAIASSMVDSFTRRAEALYGE